jgi:hypothetical protein
MKYRYRCQGYRRYVLFTTFFDAATTDHLLPPREFIEARWGSKPLATAVGLSPQRLNN